MFDLLKRAGRTAQLAIAATAAVALGLAGSAATAGKPAGAPALAEKHDPNVVRISGKEISILPELTMALGNFDKEGVKVDLIDDHDYEGPDYRMQRALNKGEIDMSVHWYQHVYYGNAHGEPTVGLMLLNGAPGLTIMVANRVKDRVRSAADFRGLKIAEGMGYSTKSVIMNLLAARAGLPQHSYTPILAAPEGRLEGTLKALETGEVDVIAFREPATSQILATGKVTTIYDLTSPESTARVLGAAFPAQSIFSSPAYIKKHPQQVQRVINAFVRTMRFVNSHTAAQIADAMPASYMKGKDRATVIAQIEHMKVTFMHRSYAFTPGHIKLMQQSIDNAAYDQTEEGVFRAVAKGKHVAQSAAYNNSFVLRAMKRIR